MADSPQNVNGLVESKQYTASDYMSRALQLGVATHAGFPGAIHQRLVLDCLYDIPTQRLDLTEVIKAVRERFDGIVLTNGQAKSALEQMESIDWVEKEGADRSGTQRYGLTPKGQTEWSAARTAGFSLIAHVRDAFFTQIGWDGNSIERDKRWKNLLDQLEMLFRREAYDIAVAFLDEGEFRNLGSREQGAPAENASAEQDLSVFFRTASGDRIVLLRKLLNSTLAFYLFRANPDADEMVRRHLRNRTFYLDTTVLYSLLAQFGELAALRDDLVRLTKDLNLRLRVTTETLHEFQESVLHYKGLLLRDGITDVNIARAVLSPSVISELDDFRRGYYQALLRDPSLSIEVYSLAYETIEEQLHKWGIPKPIQLPTTPFKDASGSWVQIDDAEPYAASFNEYMQKHPRRNPASSTAEDELNRRDALHVAWVQRERARRGISVPTTPSQVDVWFLTRDRHLIQWDREYIKANGLGRIPRCMAIEDWIESIAVFVPSIRDSDAANLLALRELALTCPPLEQKESISAEDFQAIGRAAQTFQLHPEEAARVAADAQLQKDLNKATATKGRLQAIKAGVLRLKDTEIRDLKTNLDSVTNAQERSKRVLELKERQRLRARARTTQLASEKQGLEPDAEFGRKHRTRGPLAIGLTVLLAGGVMAGIMSVPALWTDAQILRRIYVIVVATALVVSAALWIGGFAATARRWLAIVAVTVGLVAGGIDIWKSTERALPAHDSSPTPIRPQPSPAKK